MPSLKKQALGMIVGLSVQYLLGIAISMFVKFPGSGSEAQMWEAAKSQPLFWAHMLLGTLLFLNAAFISFRTFKMKDKVWKKAAGVGILAILAASFAGSSFVSSQNDAYSLLMATAFIIALLSYFWGLYYSK